MWLVTKRLHSYSGITSSSTYNIAPKFFMVLSMFGLYNSLGGATPRLPKAHRALMLRILDLLKSSVMGPICLCNYYISRNQVCQKQMDWLNSGHPPTPPEKHSIFNPASIRLDGASRISCPQI